MTESFFLAGHAANVCIGARSVTVSSEDTLFPKSSLQNGKLWSPFRFGSLDANPAITFDTNFIENGDFEADANGAAPTGWTASSGTPTVSTAQANDGTKSLALDAANEGAYQDRDVVPGNTYRFSCALYGDGTNPINLYLVDLLTGKYWNGTTWGTTKATFATKTTTGWATTTGNLTLEDPGAGHYGPGRLRILAERPATIAAAAYADSIFLWPKVTVAALALHTIPTALTITVESDDNSGFSSATNNGNLPARRFRSYLTFAGPATPERWWRFRVTGTLLEKSWVAQPILGERQVLTRTPRLPYPISQDMDQAGTEELPLELAVAPRYRLDLSWRTTEAGLTQAVERLMGGCLHGVEPVFVVADDARAEFVYGRGGGLRSFQSNRIPSGTHHELSLGFADEKLHAVTK